MTPRVPLPCARRARRAAAVAVAGLLCLFSFLPAHAQDVGDPEATPSLGTDGTVAGELRLAPAVGSVRGAAIGFVRAAALLHLSPMVAVGGEATIPVTTVRTTPPGSPDRSELSVRYGGVFVSLRRPGAPDRDPWSVSLMIGTGTARVHSSLLDTEIGTDNFLVLEPSVQRAISNLGPVRVGVRGSWRLPIGAESLPGVAASDLRGPSFGVSLGLRRDP